jgi:hypothetical protein
MRPCACFQSYAFVTCESLNGTFNNHLAQDNLEQRVNHSCEKARAPSISSLRLLQLIEFVASQLGGRSGNPVIIDYDEPEPRRDRAGVASYCGLCSAAYARGVRFGKTAAAAATTAASEHEHC